MNNGLSIALTLLGMLVLAPYASACDRCSGTVCCDLCGDSCCACKMVNKTIMVPMCVTETHMKTKIVETMKEREETYTVYTREPQNRTYKKECCYLQCEVKSKEITKTDCRRVQNPVTLEDTVKVPVVEMHDGVRRREVCTHCGKVCIEEPCTCCVTRTADTPRVQNCQREDVVFPECKCTIDYTAMTPKFDEKDCATETVYKLVPQTKTRKVQVCVPEAVQVPCDVKVTRMVAKQICCCEKCWCDLQDQKRRAAIMEHRCDKLDKVCGCLPSPADCAENCLECGKKAAALPGKMVECLGVHCKALNPLKGSGHLQGLHGTSSTSSCECTK